MDSIPFVGELCALLSPLSWSFAVILFRKTGERVTPLVLNLFKSSVALLGFAVLLALSGEVAPEGVELADYALLLVSGLIGLGLADLFFFMCLNRVGAGRQAIVNTAYSPPIILLSWLFLGESLTAWQLVGVGLILAAVLLVGKTRGAPGEQVVAGVLWGVGACFTQAISIVIVKPHLGDWPLIWTTFWRLVGGVAGTLVLVALARPADRRLSELREDGVWRVMLPATLIGSLLSQGLWMAGFKYADASVAAALNQTATLFTFALAVIVLKEPVSRRRVAGLLAGMAGVAFVTFLGEAG